MTVWVQHTSQSLLLKNRLYMLLQSLPGSSLIMLLFFSVLLGLLFGLFGEDYTGIRGSVRLIQTGFYPQNFASHQKEEEENKKGAGNMYWQNLQCFVLLLSLSLPPVLSPQAAAHGALKAVLCSVSSALPSSVVVVPFSSLARILGEYSTSHSLPVLFLFVC